MVTGDGIIHGHLHGGGHQMPMVDVPEPDSIDRDGGLHRLECIQPGRVPPEIDLGVTPTGRSRDQDRDGREGF